MIEPGGMSVFSFTAYASMTFEKQRYFQNTGLSTQRLSK